MEKKPDTIHNAANVLKKAGSNFVRWVYAKTGIRFWIWMAGSVAVWLVLYSIVPKDTPRPSVSFAPTATVEILTNAPVKIAIASRIPTVMPKATHTSVPREVPAPTLAPSTNTPIPAITYLPSSTSNTTLASSCTGQVAQQFVAVWPGLKTTLGCPGNLVNTTQFAYQNFQHGKLLWRGLELDSNNVTPDTDETFLTLYADGSWQLLHSAKFVSSDPTYACPELGSPQSYLTPKRGFGKLLCNNPDVRQKLGAATSSEIGYPTSFVQAFDNGFLVHYHRSNNTWQTIAFFFGQDSTSGTWKAF